MRYVTRPRQHYYSQDVGDVLSPQSMTVIEVGDTLEDTGLVDARGDVLYRVKDSIGFRTT